jgi:predicted MFS family arabinose efflux permease
MISWNFGVFVLARILGGFARANVSICSTIVADDCPPQVRPRGMAMIGVAFSIGFTVGKKMKALEIY